MSDSVILGGTVRRSGGRSLTVRAGICVHSPSAPAAAARSLGRGSSAGGSVESSAGAEDSPLAGAEDSLLAGAEDLLLAGAEDLLLADAVDSLLGEGSSSKRCCRALPSAGRGARSSRPSRR